MRHWFVPVLFVAASVACSKGKAGGSTPANGTAATAVAVATPATQPTPSAAPTSSAVSTAAAVQSVGTATLVLQKVYSDCGDGQTPHLLGTDVLVVLRGEDPKAKPTKEYAFCPSHGADGGVTKPQLQMWENCRSFPACQIVSADAAAPGHVEVQCGKEHIELESDGTHTVIRGSFGVREVAPHPTTVAPVKSEVRHAFVDC